MKENAPVGGHQSGLATTNRIDKWWFEAAWTGGGFLIFVIYTTWAALNGQHYYVGDATGGYLSPFYSPVLFVDVAANAQGAAPLAHAWFGEWPPWLKSIWPPFLPTSPAILILMGPLSFRMTCYYYRKFYYRSYMFTPPACAVGAFPQKKYEGESKWFIFQNIHRYTFYIAVAYIAILYYDAYLSFFRNGEFGVGVGSIILLLNPTLLAFYTFGCHAFRHLIGGHSDCFSCTKVRHSLWSRASMLNAKHMFWAWVSMIWVGLTDLYIRLVSMGHIHDFNSWGI